jgi:hypothetical protein
MEEIYKISFKISPFQEFEAGSIVTYRMDSALEYIKEVLYSRTNFFYIEEIDWKNYSCKISNGIDTITTSPDQLIEIASYLERIQDPSFHVFGNNTLENIIRFKEYETDETYLLEDQKMGILLEESIIKRSHFDFVNKVTNINQALKNYKLVRFRSEAILDIL